ncbi:MAG TPA: hypothetical protein EYO81_03385 [Gammaproteobacteria bacterium]|nr:hypothetical protein [Gammaproteobacteria bacterium]
MGNDWIHTSPEVREESDSHYNRAYTARIKTNSPHPCPQNSITRMIDGEFVWEKLFQTKGRGKAVEQAGGWFRKVKQADYAKGLKNKETHECVTVDDRGKECRFGTEFNPTRSVNRLLDEDTKKRVLEESKGLLKLSDKPFEKGKSNAHPSLEWVDENNKVYDNPIKDGMAEALVNAVQRHRDRKRKNQKSWLEEVTMNENRRLVRQMRKNGSIEHKSKLIPIS